MTTPNDTPAELRDAARKTAEYLYSIKGDCPPEIAQAIDSLRQMANEEFVAKKKSVSSQLIYDLIYPALEAIITTKLTAQLDSLEDKLLDKSVGLTNEETAVMWDEIVETIAADRARLGEQ